MATNVDPTSVTMRWLLWSATNTAPAGLMKTDVGLFKTPPTVVTASESVSIARRRLLAASATYTKAPLAVTHKPYGELNSALLPTPLVEPAVLLPASVVTVSVAVSSTRTRLLAASAMYSSAPEEESDRPFGWLKRAIVPTPSAKLAAPPASVVTAPVGVMSRTRLFALSAM